MYMGRVAQRNWVDKQEAHYRLCTCACVCACVYVCAHVWYMHTLQHIMQRK